MLRRREAVLGEEGGCTGVGGRLYWGWKAQWLGHQWGEEGQRDGCSGKRIHWDLCFPDTVAPSKKYFRGLSRCGITFLSTLRDWPLLPHARINLGFQEFLATAWNTKPIYEKAALSGQIWVMPTLNPDIYTRRWKRKTKTGMMKI